MDMKIDIEFIKQARNQKNWTQQQLAEICGLSLRTIQRIEKTGIASSESVASLSSAFDVEKQDFVIAQPNKVRSNILFEKLSTYLQVIFNMLEQFYSYLLPVVGLGLLTLGLVGLSNSSLDTRDWLLIACVFSSGVIITLSIMRSSEKRNDK